MKPELLSAKASVHVGAGEEFVTRGIPAYLIPRSVASNLGVSFFGIWDLPARDPEKALSLTPKEPLASISFGIVTQDCVK